MVKSLLTVKVEAWVGVVIIGFVAVSLSVIVLTKIADFNDYTGMLEREYSQEGVFIVSLQMMRVIDKWLADNNLNEYGDTIGTVYAGGSPLFDEASGEKIGRFEYIFRKYPDRPWRNK